MNFDKGVKTTHQGKGSIFKKQYWGKWIFTCKTSGTLILHNLQKLTQRVKHLNVRAQTLRKKTTGQEPYDIKFGNDFLAMTLKA